MVERILPNEKEINYLTTTLKSTSNRENLTCSSKSTKNVVKNI